MTKPKRKWAGPVWSHDGIVCTGETYKAKVKLTFAKGASLPDPAGSRARRSAAEEEPHPGAAKEAPGIEDDDHGLSPPAVRSHFSSRIPSTASLYRPRWITTSW